MSKDVFIEDKKVTLQVLVRIRFGTPLVRKDSRVSEPPFTEELIVAFWSMISPTIKHLNP